MNTATKLDTAQIKAQVDLRVLAGGVSELQRESATELSGPCPKCGGDDRFHVLEDWFFCRQCNEKGGDPIDFMRWLHGVGFREACDMLQPGAALPARTLATPKPQRQPAASPSFDVARRERHVASAHDLLFNSPKAETARDYLLGRGIEPHAWLTFGLGFSLSESLPGTEGKQRAPAIVVPWYRGGKLSAVRYRFLERHEYKDARGKDRQAKQTSRGSFSGLLYGGHALPEFVGKPVDHSEGRCAEQLRTLILCEGELNAVSLWQVASETLCDVLSVGSETQKIPDSLIRIVGNYGTVLTWFDRPELAKAKASQLPGAHALSSPDGQDANDLLQAGHLGGFVSTARQRVCEGAEQREALLWALYDAANTLLGVDAGTQKLIDKLKEGREQ